MDKINVDRNKLKHDVAQLKVLKEKQRDDFFKSLIEFELQQALIREIEWMATIKGRVLEKEDSRRQWEEEKTKRADERKQRIDEQQKREENWRKREEEYYRVEQDK